jgi:hypothetical protein
VDRIDSPPLLRIHSGQPERALLVWGIRAAGLIAELLAPPARLPFRREARCSSPPAPPAARARLLGHMLGLARDLRLLRQLRAPIAVSSAWSTTRRGRPARAADDEGVAAQPLQLIANGVLVGWLCDRQAARLNNAAPGRGRRSSWRHLPQPRLSNLVVPAGSVSAEAIERDLRLGLTVTAVSAAAVDPVSARAVIWVERGFEIRHGRRRRPLAPFVDRSVLEVLGGPAQLGNEAAQLSCLVRQGSARCRPGR